MLCFVVGKTIMVASALLYLGMGITYTFRLLAAFCLFLATLTPQSASAQALDNPSFEDSVFVNGGYAPSGWSNSGFGFGYTNDAHHGSKAVQIWNWYYYGEGWIVNGDAQTLWFGGGTPFSGPTVAVTGYYKYDLGQNGGATDSAYCDLLLFRYNTSTQTRDTLAYSRKLLGPVATYTYFQTWVDNSTFQVQTDSLVVSFASSVSGFCDNQSNGECLYLTIDNLQLELPVGIPQPLAWDGEAQVYPNPSIGRVNVRLPDGFDKEAELQIHALDGRLLFTKKILNVSEEVDLSSLPSATHVWTLVGRNGKRLSGKVSLQ